MDELTLPEEILRGIARQIGARLDDELNRRPEGGLTEFESEVNLERLRSARFELCESFEVWRLRSGAENELAQTREDMVTLGRPSGVWHHQIRASVGGGAPEAVAYALTQPSGLPRVEWSLRDLFFSRLAANLDRAITLADEVIHGDVIVRLLSLPEYKLDALWFIGRSAETNPPRATSTLIVADAPPSFLERGRVMWPLNSADFVHALAGTKLGMGLRV